MAVAKKTTARKSPAKKSAGEEGRGAKKAPAKKTAAKKTAAKKTAAKKAAATARKTAAKKTTAKKTAGRARKTAAKKTAAKKTHGAEDHGAEDPGARRPRRRRPPRAEDHRAQDRRTLTPPSRAGRVRLVRRARGQRSVINANTSAAAKPWGAPRSARRARTRAAEGGELLVVDGLHRRLELAPMRLEGGELGVDRRADVLDVRGLVRLPEQQRRRSVRLEPVLGMEVGVASGHDGLADEQAGVAVIRMEPVALPGVVTEHDLRTQPADDAGHVAPGRAVAVQLAVDAAEEHDLAAPGRRPAAGPPRAARPSCGRRARSGPPTDPTSPSTRRCRRGGARRTRRRPTWRACRRRRTRRRRGGRRQPGPKWARAGWPSSRPPGPTAGSAAAGQDRSQPLRQHVSEERMGEVVGVVDVEGEERVDSDLDAVPRLHREAAGAAGTTRCRTTQGHGRSRAGRARWCRRGGGRARGVTVPARANVPRSCASGMSLWTITRWSKPLPAIVARPASTAPLRPRPGLHSTSAPAASAHVATPSSSHATNTGDGRAASTTRPASQRASSARAPASRIPARRRFAAENRLTGIRTAASTAPTVRAGLVGSVAAHDGHRGHRRARPAVARRRDRDGGRSRRGTVRRRSTGTSPPTTAGTRRARRRRCGSAGCRAHRCSRPGCGCPGGDAVHRAWSVADAGGWTVVEVVNDSPLPFACAFTRGDIATSRPPADVPIAGIDLPPASVVLPVGHRASVTVGLCHDGTRAGHHCPRSARPRRRGGSRLAGARRAGQPTGAARGTARRRARRRPLRSPARRATRTHARTRSSFLLAAGELVRLGEIDEASAGRIGPDVAAAAEQVARRDGWDADAALDAAALVLARAEERRGVADLVRIAATRTAWSARRRGRSTGSGPSPRSNGASPAARSLFPDGIPAAWRGAELEAHDLAVGPATTLSFAVRWHGAHPAVLWQVTGEPVELRAPAVDPAWRTDAASGEALWRTARRGGPQ